MPIFCSAEPQGGAGLLCMDTIKERKYSYGYVIAAACFGIQAIGVGTSVCYGVFFNPLISEFGWSRTAISGAYSVAFFLMGLFGILVGRLNDRIGPRNVMAVTGFLFGLGHLLMSRLGAVWQLYVFYGVIIGIVTFSGTVGGAIGPFLAGYIFNVTAGYSPAFWLCTLMSALGLVLLLLPKPIEEKRQKENKVC